MVGFRLGLKAHERIASNLDNCCPIFVAQCIGGIETRSQFRRDVRRRLLHGVLGVRHLVNRYRVEEFRGQREQDGDLSRHGYRSEFRLFQTGADSLSMFDDLAGVFVQAGAKPGKGLEFLELRVGEFEVTRHRAISRPLRLATDARDGSADIHRGQHPQFEQRRRKVDLPVRDGDEVGRNVGGNVLRLGLDDGECSKRAAAEFRTQVGSAFEQARVDVEDVAGKGFATGWPAKQQGKLAIGTGVLREVVVNNQHIAARFHEMLRDAGRGVRSDVGKTWRVVTLGHDNDGVIHRALLPQDGDGLCHGGSALANGTIDAHDILTSLVEDSVDRNGGFSRLPVTENELALAPADRNERIDNCQSGLERHGDGRAVHDGGGGAFDRQALARSHRALAIERPTERVDDASQQLVADDHIHDPARALDLIAGVQMPVFAEQNDADLVLVHVEGNAEHIAGKLYQLLKAYTGKAGDLGDAGSDADDRTHLPWHQ